MTMRTLVAVAALAVLPLAPPNQSATSTQGKTRPFKQYSIEQFLDTTSISGASFSHDESRLLFSSNKTGIWNAYTMPVSGGAWTPVTASTTDSTYAVSFFPNDDRVMITRDQGGNELNHLYVRTAAGEERDLTPGTKLKAQFLDWTPAGDAFYVVTNERDPKFFDIYRLDATGYTRTLVYENKDGYFPSDVSDDGKWVSLQKVNTTNDGDLFVWNAATGKTDGCPSTAVTRRSFRPASIANSTYLYYVTNDGSEFSALRRYALADGRREDVHKSEWDVTFTSLSKRGRYRAIGVNTDGRPRLSIVDTSTGAAVPMPAIPNAGVASVRFAPSETKAALYVNGDRSPNNLYVLDLKTSKLTRLTESLSPQVDPEDMVDVQTVRFKARDGLTIPNYLLETPSGRCHPQGTGARARARRPRRADGARLQRLNQYLANHGYVVLGINNRGSSGYGKTFFAADDKKHGREPLWDCVDAKKYLQALDYVDPDRIGIIGGSYGGYMVLAALAFQPKEFDVGVDLFGVANWIRTLESIPAWWEAQRKALYAEMGDPVADRRDARGGLAAAARRPDPQAADGAAGRERSARAEGGIGRDRRRREEERRAGRYKIFPDEGHGFTKKKNQIDGYSAVLNFLDKYLKTE